MKISCWYHTPLRRRDAAASPKAGARARNKRFVLWALLAVWLLVLIAVLAATAARPVSAAPRRLPVYSVERADRKIALTFNCAWGDETTDAVLSILKKHGIRATFFFVGSFAEQYPQSVKKIANAGHAVGNHSMRHRDPTAMTREELQADMAACNRLLESLTGLPVRLYRAPSGSYDGKTVETAEALGMTAIQWSADSVDWKNITPEKMVQRVCSKTFPGGILLFHLGKENTVEALPDLLRELEAAHYEFCTVEELLLSGGSYVDPNGRQRPA